MKMLDENRKHVEFLKTSTIDAFPSFFVTDNAPSISRTNNCISTYNAGETSPDIFDSKHCTTTIHNNDIHSGASSPLSTASSATVAFDEVCREFPLHDSNFAKMQSDNTGGESSSVSNVLTSLDFFLLNVIAENQLPSKDLLRNLESEASADLFPTAIPCSFPYQTSTSTKLCVGSKGDSKRLTPDDINECNTCASCLTNRKETQGEVTASSVVDAIRKQITTSQESYKRVHIVLLCFVSLPFSEATEECFIPTPHVCDMKIQVQPIVKVTEAALFLLQFRSQVWLGIVSNAPTLNLRRRQVLCWVRNRKTITQGMFTRLPKNNSFMCQSISCPELYSEVNHSVEYNSLDSPLCSPEQHSATLDNSGLIDPQLSASRLRQCSAVLSVLSGEIVGIAPCQIATHSFFNSNSQTQFLDINKTLIWECINEWLTILAGSFQSSIPCVS